MTRVPTRVILRPAQCRIEEKGWGGCSRVLGRNSEKSEEL